MVVESPSQQPEESQAFDAWSDAHQFRYEDRRGTRLVVARGCMRERVEDTEVYFSTKSKDGSLPFLPLAQVEALRDRLTEIVEETRRGPVGSSRRPPAALATEGRPQPCSCCGGDPLTVCDACGEHTCWDGRFMCDESALAGTRQVAAIDVEDPVPPAALVEQLSAQALGTLRHVRGVRGKNDERGATSVDLWRPDGMRSEPIERVARVITRSILVALADAVDEVPGARRFIARVAPTSIGAEDNPPDLIDGLGNRWWPSAIRNGRRYYMAWDRDTYDIASAFHRHQLVQPVRESPRGDVSSTVEDQ